MLQLNIIHVVSYILYAYAIIIIGLHFKKLQLQLSFPVVCRLYNTFNPILWWKIIVVVTLVIMPSFVTNGPYLLALMFYHHTRILYPFSTRHICYIYIARHTALSLCLGVAEIRLLHTTQCFVRMVDHTSTLVRLDSIKIKISLGYS